MRVCACIVCVCVTRTLHHQASAAEAKAGGDAETAAKMKKLESQVRFLTTQTHFPVALPVCLRPPALLSVLPSVDALVLERLTGGLQLKQAKRDIKGLEDQLSAASKGKVSIVHLVLLHT